MKLARSGERLTIFVGETDQYGDRPLYTEIVEWVQQAGLASLVVREDIDIVSSRGRNQA
jgi:PII-like signaling protein